MTSKHDAQAPHNIETMTIHRRGVLGKLGLAGMGLVASTTAAEAFTFQKKGKSIPKVSVPTSSGHSSSRVPNYSLVSDLPADWRRSNGALAADYVRYLSKLGLKRVSPAQVIEAHAKKKGSTWNSIPPKAWWKRMAYTLKVVDRIALEMNVSSVEVISAYRNPGYNARCAGAKAGSWHQANAAVDVKFPVKASRVTATARELRNLGLFRGGVGGYWNFTHIDCRGKNVNW